MRERPILFNGDMVRAILAGRKVQTRRAIEPQPYIDASGNFCWNGSNYGQDTAGVPMARTLVSQIPSARTGRVLCPFGKIGDRLWVRETWQQVHPLQVLDGRYSQRGYAGIPGPPPVGYRTIYRADGEYPAIYSLGGEPWPYRSLEPFERDGMQAFVDEPRWTPSVHMPRWACRLVLEITAVRVERLQAISEADALAEGIEEIAGRFTFNGGMHESLTPQLSFQTLWDSTGGQWAANPWVWVIEFKQINEVSNG